ncbi:hypothetical protein [Mucilaginibacter sp.]
MKKLFFKRRFVFMPFIAVAFAALISFAVMQLWNGLMPDIFHLGTITYWQALGLLALSKLLFGFGGRGRFGGGAPWGRARMQERFAHLSDEEREAFKARMKGRCGRGWRDFTEPASEKQPTP